MRGAITRKTVIQPRQGPRSAVLQRLNDGLSFLDLACTGTRTSSWIALSIWRGVLTKTTAGLRTGRHRQATSIAAGRCDP